MMKKFAVIIMIIYAVALIGCSGKKEAESFSTPTPLTSKEPLAKSGGTSVYKTGLGVVKSSSETVAAAVTLNGEGKIIKCSIDAVELQKMADKPKEERKTKSELGINYGLKSPVGEEWNEQIDSFADWTIGKTVYEIKRMPIKKSDDGDGYVPDFPELSSAVSVEVDGYIRAVEKAALYAKDASEATGDIKTGLGIGLGDETIFAAVTIDSTGKIIASAIDKAGVDKEWRSQIRRFTGWTMGKRISDVVDMKLRKTDSAAKNNLNAQELVSTINIDVDDEIKAIRKAVNNAK